MCPQKKENMEKHKKTVPIIFFKWASEKKHIWPNYYVKKKTRKITARGNNLSNSCILSGELIVFTYALMRQINWTSSAADPYFNCLHCARLFLNEPAWKKYHKCLYLNIKWNLNLAFSHKNWIKCCCAVQVFTQSINSGRLWA